MEKFCCFHPLHPDYKINFEITDSPFPFLLWLNHSKSMSLPCNSSHIIDKWIQVKLCIMNGVFVSVKTSNHFEIMTERLSSASFIQESYQVCWRARLLWMKGKYLAIALCHKSNWGYVIKDFETLPLIFSTSKYFRWKFQP